MYNYSTIIFMYDTYYNQSLQQVFELKLNLFFKKIIEHRFGVKTFVNWTKTFSFF